MARLSNGRPNGSLHNMATIEALSPECSHILLCSERTLYILHNLSELDVTFWSRYADTVYGDGTYEPVGVGSAYVDLLQETVNNFQLEVIPMTSEFIAVLEEIRDAIGRGGSAGCSDCPPSVVGVGPEPEGPYDGQPAPPDGSGIGISYSEPSGLILDRKCLAANAINDAVLEAFTGLEQNNVGGLLGLGVGIIAAIVGTIVAGFSVTPLSALMFASAGSLAKAVGAMFHSTTSFTAAVTAIQANGQAGVQALFDATNGSDARSNYLDAVFGPSSGSYDGNRVIAREMLRNEVVNLLWYDTDTSEAFFQTYVPTYACTGGPNPPSGALVFVRNADNSGDRGSGTLHSDGTVMTLTSEVDPTVGLHYIDIKWGLSNTGTYFGGCGNAISDGFDISGDDLAFDFTWLTTEFGTPKSSGAEMALCRNSTHTPSPGPTITVTYTQSEVQFRSINQFQITCTVVKL